ncbi:beta-glycosyltransferase/ family 2 [Synechococcus sp. BIOS-U3-1]|uniref:glycosyltransferase n=1 Tax=Synechococcus sp. BIOS-U3-1 TaxID=1400865 RepID=UPI001645BAB4|nr:glycosyltransferase [Synechococcus sp. BIOS-U3-1]QNI57038.1 beta-glycosyltransferase/ family 2 [Synechococcus sp. BIOS-U3-1]
MNQRAPLILVVGMHRSGTSLLGSLLPACGIAMPGPLLDGDTHNPEGYFERADVTALQEELLIDLERWWPSPRGMQPLPQGWLDSNRGQRALGDLKTLLHSEAEAQTGPWAIKDPRSSLLLPLWKQACESLNIPLQLLLAIRDPAEVMVSLVRRDQSITGMDGWRAQRLWWHHNAQVLRDGADLPMQVLSYSHWFDPDKALRQVRNLAPLSSKEQQQQALKAIRPEHRRSQQSQLPAPVAGTVKKLYRRLAKLALEPTNRQSLEQWLSKQLDPPALAPLPRRRSQLKRNLQIKRGLPPANRVADHPWGRLAEVMCGSQGPAAEHQLHSWETHGFRSFELEHIAALAGPVPAAESWRASHDNITIQVRGGDLNQWPVHAWIQHCPIDSDPSKVFEAQVMGSQGVSPIALNLADVLIGAEGSKELLHLAQLERVWDPDRKRVQFLRQFGINASWVTPSRAVNHYLRASTTTWESCATELGLAEPRRLKDLGSTLCLSNTNPGFNRNLQAPLLSIPGFNSLESNNPKTAWLMAQWLQGCLNAGLEIVRQQPTPEEDIWQAWQVLVQSNQRQTAPILILQEPIGAKELLQELNWYRQGCPSTTVSDTPKPSSNLLYTSGAEPLIDGISVCVSLYNYSSRILDALNSVLEQTDAARIELIVVDDASSDNSAAVVQSWMDNHHSHLGRCLLIQHSENGGLASARNTAFEAASSAWCFVLDADNSLDSNAVKHCGHLALQADCHCAVIHSLVRVKPEQGSDDQRVLVSDIPWQQQQFRGGNYIDAMALVRHEAWKAVGGYTHIPGGWEDFDFWCSLIDRGWHGVLCPQVLATYTSHENSMRAESTTQQERRLSRLLQMRHPWLDLPQCHDRAIWPL